MNNISFEDYLAAHGTLVYKNTGVSMLPLLRQGRDAFVVEAMDAQEPCRQWDVVLYRRQPGVYVLHRIIRVNDGSCDILGDNSTRMEYAVPREQIFGRMTSYIRKGKTRSIDHPLYRLYVLLWCRPYRLRVAVKKLLAKMKGMIRHAG